MLDPTDTVGSMHSQDLLMLSATGLVEVFPHRFVADKIFGFI